MSENENESVELVYPVEYELPIHEKGLRLISIENTKAAIKELRYSLGKNNPAFLDLAEEIKSLVEPEDVNKSSAFQMTCQITALHEAFKINSTDIADTMNTVLDRLGYFEHIQNPTVSGNRNLTEAILINNSLAGYGLYTPAYFGGKLSKHAFTPLNQDIKKSGNVLGLLPSIYVDFYYTKNFMIMELTHLSWRAMGNKFDRTIIIEELDEDREAFLLPHELNTSNLVSLNEKTRFAIGYNLRQNGKYEGNSARILE